MPEFCFGSWQTQRYLLGRVRFAPQSGHAPVASASSLRLVPPADSCTGANDVRVLK